MKKVFMCFSIGVSSFILSFSSLWALDCSNVFSKDNEFFQALENKEKSAWMSAKASHFTSPYFSSKFQLEHRYLNKIIDTLLDGNRVSLDRNEKYKSDISDIVVLIKNIPKNYRKDLSWYSSIGNGLIELTTNGVGFTYLPHEKDVLVAAVLSREISHTINLHIDKIKNLKLKGASDDVLLEQQRNFEIEADELGFNLYANAGFPIDMYRKQFLIAMELSFFEQTMIAGSELGYSNLDVLGMWFRGDLPDRISRDSFTLYDSKKCILEGERAIVGGTFYSFLNSIKYNNPKDTTPTYCWRYWNLYVKELNLVQNRIANNIKVSATITPLYLQVKLDNLDKYGSLDSVYDAIKQKILNNEDLNYFLVRLADKDKNNKVELLESYPNTVWIRANDIFIDTMFQGTAKIKDFSYIIRSNIEFRHFSGAKGKTYKEDDYKFLY